MIFRMATLFGGICMNAKIRNVVGIVALIGAGYAWGHQSTAVRAEDVKDFGHNSIPREWGHVVAATGNFIVLEDTSGNVHMYNLYTHQSMGDISRK
jgi:hypothetical protein